MSTRWTRGIETRRRGGRRSLSQAASRSAPEGGAAASTVAQRKLALVTEPSKALSPPAALGGEPPSGTVAVKLYRRAASAR